MRYSAFYRKRAWIAATLKPYQYKINETKKKIERITKKEQQAKLCEKRALSIKK
jgi:hypothetical protein